MPSRNGKTPVHGFLPLPAHGERWDVTPLPPAPPGPSQPPPERPASSAAAPSRSHTKTALKAIGVGVAIVGMLVVLGKLAWSGAERLGAKADRSDVVELGAKVSGKADVGEVRAIEKQVYQLRQEVTEQLGGLQGDLKEIGAEIRAMRREARGGRR